MVTEEINIDLTDDNIEIDTEQSDVVIKYVEYDDTEVRQMIHENTVEIAALDVAKANKSQIPTKLKDLSDDNTHRTVTDTEKTTWNNKSDFSGNYNDLSNKPSIPSKTSDLTNDSGFIDNTVNNLTNYELKTNTGATIELSINSSTYVVTLNLKNSYGTVLSTGTIDLPLESVVVGGDYDSTNKKIILTLQSGSTIDIPVGDLVSGLQSEITSNNKLDSDLVDDTNQTHKFVSASEKNTWNNKSDFSGSYNDLTNKPIIPDDLSDLNDDSTHRLVTDIEKTTWSGKQDSLVSGTNIKTINNESILGSGNITIQGGGGSEIYIGDEQDAPSTTKLLIDDEYVDFGDIEIVNTLSGNEINKAPSVWAVNHALGDIVSLMEVL